MKKIYNSLHYAALSVIVCFGLSFAAHAQKNNAGGGSSTSVSSSSSSNSRPSGGGSGGGGAARPSGGGSFGVSRPSGGMSQRVGVTQGNMNRQGGAPRGNYGYSPRQGGISMQPNGGGRANFISPQRQGISINQNIASRGFYNHQERVGVSTRGPVAYRNSGGAAHDRRDFWGGRNYFYHNHGYYKTYYQPRLGFTCTVLPYGYYPFFWGDEQYYYSDGLFYEYENDQYTVVEPPVGAEVTTLPSDAQSIVINGQQYYESAGVYYQPYTKDDGTQVYVVAGKDGELNTNATMQDNQPRAPQIGDIVNQLPSNCRKIIVSGQKLYVSEDGVYYQPQVDAQGVTTYKIVGLPSDEIDQN